MKKERKVRVDAPKSEPCVEKSDESMLRIVARQDNSDLIGMLFRVDAQLGNEPVLLMLDSGATITVIEKAWADQMREKCPDGQADKTEGSFVPSGRPISIQ